MIESKTQFNVVFQLYLNFLYGPNGKTNNSTGGDIMVKITVRENGPYRIETDGQFVVVKDGKEEVLTQKTIALCRCGGSENKPFCDGTHKKIGFRAAGQEIIVK